MSIIDKLKDLKPEPMWKKRNRARDEFVDKVMDSLTGKDLIRRFQLEYPQCYPEIVKEHVRSELEGLFWKAYRSLADNECWPF